MDLIKNINDTVREKNETEAALAATAAVVTAPKGKTVSDYLNDIQGDKPKEK